MSKASKVRDAILEEIGPHLPEQDPDLIQAFWTPDFLREDMESGAILGVQDCRANRGEVQPSFTR